MVRSKKITQNKEKVKTRRLRDVNAPKVPVNAYTRFFKANLKTMRRESENPSEANVRLASQWKTMAEEDKKPYFDEYQKELGAYYEQVKEYKETDQYREYLKTKVEKRRWTRMRGTEHEQNPEEAMPKADPFKALFPKGIRIYSQEFLDYNKEQERKLRTMRKQNNEVKEECERIHELVEHINGQLWKIREENLRHEVEINEMEGSMSKWRQQILGGLGQQKLLDGLKLEQQSSTEELLAQLEEVGASTSSKNAEQMRMVSAVKQVLSNIRFGSI